MIDQCILNLTDIEIAWLAGLFEGEASFGIDIRSKKRYQVSSSPPAPFIKIAMIDEDVISKVSQLLKKNYFSSKRLTVKNKQVFICHIGDRATLNYLLPRIFPYMGIRRQQKIQQCLDLLVDYKIWYENGGKSKMAKQGGLAKQNKKTI